MRQIVLAGLGVIALLSIAACAADSAARVPVSSNSGPGAAPALNLGVIGAQAQDAGDVLPADEAEEGDTEASEAAPEEEILSNSRFVRVLTDTGNATVGDCVRLTHMLYYRRMQDRDNANLKASVEQYASNLADAGVIEAGEADDPGALLTHGVAAHMFARAMDLKGGVWWTAIGGQRYGHREMVDRNLFSDENPRQYISGAELRDVFGKCLKAVGN